MDAASEDILRKRISDLLVGGLKTQTEPYPETVRELASLRNNLGVQTYEETVGFEVIAVVPAASRSLQKWPRLFEQLSSKDKWTAGELQTMQGFPPWRSLLATNQAKWRAEMKQTFSG